MSPAQLGRVFRTLEQDGLVSLGGMNHLVVTEVNPRQLDRVFTLRRALQPDAFARAATVSPVEGFTGLEAVMKGFTVVEWLDDHAHGVERQVFTDFLAPVLTPIEMSLMIELEVASERSQRIGYHWMLQHHPADMQTLANSYRQVVDACRMRSAKAAADAQLSYVRLAEDISHLGLRTAEVISI